MSAELTEAEVLRRELVAEKHAQARGLMKQQGIDLWLTFCREGSDLLLPFLTGNDYIAGTAALMVFADGPSVAVVADYDVTQAEGAFDEVHGYSLDWESPFLATLKARNPKSIAINYSEADHGIDGLTLGLYKKLVRTIEPIGLADRLVSSESITELVRAVKTPSEIERIRRACEITQRIFDDLTGMLKPGLTEMDIAGIMRERMSTYGVEAAWEPTMCPSVTTSKSRRGHTPPGAEKFEPGDLLAIDFGVKYEGYCSDIQRTWYMRKPGETAVPEHFQKQWDAVLEATEISEEMIKPGVTGIEVDIPTRAHIVHCGFSFTHATGHQLGRTVHDGGMVLGPDNARYRERSKGTIHAGMIFTLEPVVGPIGLEEDVVVTADGCEYLIPPQKAIYLV